MMKLERTPAPEFLQKNYKTWGYEFADKRKENPAYSFTWKSYEGKRINEILRGFLVSMTRNHCSFCDSYPLGTASHQTIEHFRPKSQYPLLAYVWHNLFLCCDVCQNAKNEKFDRKLLKPDKPDYCFEKYFVLNYKTGEIEANPSASESDQGRARITIEMYSLNKKERLHSRLHEYKKYQKLCNDNDFCLDDFSYRFFLL